jgi:hypothetical protein
MQLCNGPSRVQLKLVGYQYPQIRNERYDSNWLLVEGHIKHERREWRFRDPCLLTWKVAELASWLEALSSGAIADTEVSFIEPNISFAAPARGVLRVSFALEALPPGVDGSFSLSLSIDGEVLRKAAQDLRLQLDQFPERLGH